MANIPEHLLSTLNDLETSSLGQFQWHLRNGVEGLPGIPMAQLEKSTRHDTVDRMVQMYGPDGAVKITLAILKKMNFNQLAEELRTKIRGSGEDAEVQILPSEPRTREDFLKYFCWLTLDPNTAHCSFRLTKRNRVVTRLPQEKQVYAYAERFDRIHQVLCTDSICGRSYWEVEWSSRGNVYIAVSYKSISRKGEECRFGHNAQSWSLQCSPHFSFNHNNEKIPIPGPSASRIGVYVDHSAGTLSFYRVSDTMTLIHTVHARFTEPLYAGFRIGLNSTVMLRDPI